MMNTKQDLQMGQVVTPNLIEILRTGSAVLTRVKEGEYKTMKTYPEMNDKIIDLLRRDTGNPLMLYAAQRIEELEADVRGLKGCDATIALLPHQMRTVCERVGLGADHALHDYVPLLGNKIDLLQRELRDEQVRHSEWEKMYNQAIASIAEPEPEDANDDRT